MLPGVPCLQVIGIVCVSANVSGLGSNVSLDTGGIQNDQARFLTRSLVSGLVLGFFGMTADQISKCTLHLWKLLVDLTITFRMALLMAGLEWFLFSYFSSITTASKTAYLWEVLLPLGEIKDRRNS